jgi:hypothetical protein
MYTLYCNTYESANETVKAAMKRKDVAEFIEVFSGNTSPDIIYSVRKKIVLD